MKQHLFYITAITLLTAGATTPPSVSIAQASYAFQNVTDSVGLTAAANDKAAWGDYDNDGWVDLFISGKVWHNNLGLSFTLDTLASITITAGHSGIWGDYNNDGYLDLFCWQWNWDPLGSGEVRLYRNNGNGTFADESANLPKPTPPPNGRGALWADLNNDGFIDLYTGGYEQGSSYTPQPDYIYMNNGNGTFSLKWTESPVTTQTRGVTAADYDEDGDMDIFLSVYRLRANVLWKNNGQGTMTNAAAVAGVQGSPYVAANGTFYGHTIGSCWGDLDNDGHIDLFVGNFSHPPTYQDRPMFMKNLGPSGAYKFSDKSSTAGLAWQESFASPALGDYDNDGDLDLYYSTVYANDRCVLYQNNGNWTFANVTAASGLSGLKETYMGAWADFNNDGCLDLMTQGRLYKNLCSGTNHWLKIKLIGDGVTCNKSAIGAKVRIDNNGQILFRQVESATGEGNENDLVLHFGLGDSISTVSLSVIWTEGDTQQVVTSVDTMLTITHMPLSVNDASAALSAIRVYPNPSNGVFQITSGELRGTSYELEIYNVMGEKVYSAIINSQSSIIHVEQLAGVYYCRMKTKEKSIVQKMVIVK